MIPLVAVPYVPGKLRPETMGALDREESLADVVSIQLDDADFGYGHLLSALWRRCAMADRALIVVEQDVVIPEGALAHFAACPEDWCAHSYPVYWGDISQQYGGPYGLGCVRFSAALMQREPTLVAVALTRREDPRRPRGYWSVLDSAITGVLRSLGYVCHEHQPPAEHLHVYNREGAYVG